METKMIPVSEAVERTGYSRQRIHQLADDKKIGSEFLTPTFRLVNIEDLLAHAEEHGYELPEPVR